MKILVTGGAGYIGSHTAIELVEAGHQVSVVDNLSNSSPEALSRVQEITGRELDFHKIDLRDRAGLDAIFGRHPFDAVIHFAAKKAVGESVRMPLMYYDNNVAGTLILCETMAKYGVKNIVFSSSCTVYGQNSEMPLREDAPLGAINPYGRTKLMMEWILRDLQAADPAWNVILLRYFNPVGAHPSGRIGEDPHGVPENLLPYIAQVAVGRRPFLRIFGDDYPTRDGTGVRDYIHVVDLAQGHLAALEKLAQNPGAVAYNLGTGEGYTVLEVLRAFEKAAGRDIPFQILERRPGDAAEAYADPSLAERELGWKARRGLDEMVTDVWRWQSQNPDGYA